MNILLSVFLLATSLLPGPLECPDLIQASVVYDSDGVADVVVEANISCWQYGQPLVTDCWTWAECKSKQEHNCERNEAGRAQHIVLREDATGNPDDPKQQTCIGTCSKVAITTTFVCRERKPESQRPILRS